MQMADYVVETLKHNRQPEKAKPFRYINLGTMATIDRKKAVAEIGGLRFGGFVAWMLWLVIHLRSILGVRNRIFVFLNWIWNYVNYRQSLRLILK
jgi:NADH dehydrogenase